MQRIFSGKRLVALFLLGAAAAIASRAQSFTTLVNFTWANGGDPYGSGLVQGVDGNLYGTTTYGGGCSFNDLGCGSVFKMTPDGTLTTLHFFTGPDGAFPYAGLFLARDGNFYGTTSAGGANCASSEYCGGTVFKITRAGDLTTLYNFCSQVNCADGSQPSSGLIQAMDGNLYGTTANGGQVSCSLAEGCGTVFSITTGGTLTTLYNFSGYVDPLGTLVQGPKGDLYGTTLLGGTFGFGMIFWLTQDGQQEKTLYSFCSQPSCADGSFPAAGLILATDGNLYGTTEEGGNAAACDGGCGTIFRITPRGALTTLYSFAATDGFDPAGGLRQATDGNLYGTTVEGGYEYLCPGGCGTLFEITLGGALTTLYSITDFSEASDLGAPLVQATNGVFYGTSQAGGSDGAGTVFSLATGLGPFVKTISHSGAVGAFVRILGYNLTGTTSVTFNGTAAVFTVVSGSEITTTVPAGATTGTVEAVTPNGTLSSNVPFEVLP